MHDLLTTFDKKQQVNVAILDSSKAFDRSLHDLLLLKMSNNDVDGPLYIKWLSSLLKHQSIYMYSRCGRWRTFKKCPRT